MPKLTPLLALLLCSGLLLAQGGKGKTPAANDPKYLNDDLGITFDGVYGWAVKKAEGSGAWTQLVSYSESAFDAEVRLLVRSNSYQNFEEMRASLRKEFTEGGEPAPGAPVYKEITFKDVEMREGTKLLGIEIEAVELSLSEEGKKRENQLVIRTYYGANRLFRILCEVRRSRAKKVRDLLDRALAGLAVKAADEEAARGTPFRSVRGNWHATIPDGFTAVLGPSSWNSDMMFEAAAGKISVYVYAYVYEGSARDHLEEMQEHYRDGGLEITRDEAKVLGGDGFHCTLTKADRVTLISAAVVAGQVYRLHTNVTPDQVEVGRRIHDKFLGSMQIGR